MPSDFGLGWRDRAIALATLGAVAIGRSGFEPFRTGGLSPREMQALAYLAVEDETDYGHAGLGSLSIALGCDEEALQETLRELADKGLLSYTPDEQLDEDEETIDAWPPICLTALGAEHVEVWLGRLRPLFRGWPPDRPDVDDAIG